MKVTTTPLRAIREKCLDCSCGSAYEVKHCRIDDCPLYPFRDGHNPNRKGIGNKDTFAKLNKQKKDEAVSIG